MSPELEAEFRAALESAKGDVNEATQRMLRRLDLDVKRRPADPQFYTLFNEWHWVKVAGASFYWVGFIQNVLTNIQRRSKRAKAEV